MAIAAVLAAGTISTKASATVDVQLNLQSNYAISDSITVVKSINNTGAICGACYSTIPVGNSSLRIIDPTPGATPLAAWLIGLDAGASDHLIVSFNSTYAQTVIGREFGKLFSAYSEAALVADLKIVTDYRSYFDRGDFAAVLSALDDVGDFGNYLYSQGAFTPANNGSLTLVRFSAGTEAGSGTASVIVSPDVEAVPEPATWTMLILGFGLVGGAMRRQRVRRVTYA